MLTVSLHNARFNAPVGLYPQEMKTGNELEIDVSVSKQADIGELPLINYEWLYEVVKLSVATPVALLENIVQHIILAVQREYPEATVTASVRKLHPPMDGSIEAASVSFTAEGIVVNKKRRL